jgi:hypothetical protein
MSKAQSMDSYLTERQQIALAMRAEGALFKDVGVRLNVTTARARQVYLEADKKRRNAGCFDRSSGTLAMAMERAGIKTIEEARRAYLSGALTPGARSANGWPIRYGWRCHQELAALLGLKKELANPLAKH